MRQADRDKVMRQIEQLERDGVEQYTGSLKGMPSGQVARLRREGRLTALAAGITPAEIAGHRRAQRQAEADQAKAELEAAQARYTAAASAARG